MDRMASAKLTNQLWFRHSSRNFPLMLWTAPAPAVYLPRSGVNTIREDLRCR
jgi:hypothetical protein